MKSICLIGVLFFISGCFNDKDSQKKIDSLFVDQVEFEKIESFMSGSRAYNLFTQKKNGKKRCDVLNRNGYIVNVDVDYCESLKKEIELEQNK
jgi:hypothetical protein